MMARWAPIALILSLAAPMTLAPSPADAAIVSKKQVQQAGRDAAKQVEKEHGLWNSATEQQRVRRIGRRLAEKAKYQEGTVYAFQILNMEDVNAFALPDGHVYVTKGLMTRVGKDDHMLAAVLGHEIGHISELHAHKRIERALKQQLGYSIFGTIFGDKLGDIGNLAADIANTVIFNEYSQDQEIDGDQYGIVLASQAGYRKDAMVDFLEILAADEKQNKTLEYLRSHPYSATRVTVANKFMEDLNAGRITLAEYTSPKPPATAFTYAYPAITGKGTVKTTDPPAKDVDDDIPVNPRGGRNRN